MALIESGLCSTKYATIVWIDKSQINHNIYSDDQVIYEVFSVGLRKGRRKMKDAVHNTNPVAPVERNGAHRKKRLGKCCSICTRHMWFDYVSLTEPEGVPEPRHSWTLCHECHVALVTEMRRSPVRSPLRLRVAIGIIASERWPLAYSTQESSRVSDHRWIVILSVGFFVAMLLHLVLIVMLAGLTTH
jgi:hypothetical protein